MRKKTTILKMIKTKTAVKIVVTLIPYVQKAKQKIEPFSINLTEVNTLV